ncbi:MAG: aspartate-semialdehyde dehydrogenase [Planctomycetes bacterium]|nr:aspartate-semialdehyde dehydrogenase [Planctomycetota bacterium]MBI3845829.1 aspartate-semialdehyde dehydrogenase [Planctomycetota bacterium]
MSIGVRVAVVGATGAVGAEFLRLVEKKPFPIRSVRLFASERSAGREIDVLGQRVRVENLDGADPTGIDVAFFSAGGAISRAHAPRFVSAGACVIDNSSAFRMDPAVPLVVPEINLDAIPRRPGLIANPNCSTIVLLMALHPLHRVARVESVVASTYQAVSGTGARAIEELESQVRAWVESPGEPAASEVYPHPIAFNVIPKVQDVVDRGYTQEEMKMQNETRKILRDPAITVSATCVRVPVFRSHSIAARIVTERKIGVEEARRALAAAPGVKLVDDPASERYPMPLYTSGEPDIQVGRIREDWTSDRGLLFFVAGDQLLKGAAQNGMQIAAALVASGRLA